MRVPYLCADYYLGYERGWLFSMSRDSTMSCGNGRYFDTLDSCFIYQSMQLMASEIIFYRMQEEEGLQLQLIETTAASSTPLNRYCFFDGSTLIYLAGAHIVMHNVFQNTKQFVERLSDGEVQAMSFQASAEIGVVLASKYPCTRVEFYSGSKRVAVVQLNEELEISDLIFLQKKRVCLLAFSPITKQSSLIFVSSSKKIRKIQLTERGYSLAYNGIKLYILTYVGCLEFSIEKEILEKKKCYSNLRLNKILLDESENEILFDCEGNCGIAGSGEIAWIKMGGECQAAVKVPEGILVALKGEFALLHLQMENGKLQLAGRFELSDRGRGGIIDLHKPLDDLNLALTVKTQHKESWKTQHYLFNLSALSSEKKFVSPFLKLQTGGNSGDISHLQVTIPAEIFCLSGTHVLNYSYVEQIEKKHKYTIHESPRMIAVHPLGHQIFCAFETAAKFYQKVEMQLVEIWSEVFLCSAAKYTQSGLLVLCLLEEGSHNIIVYNSNSFRKLRAFTGLYLKHAVTRIEFDQAERELILYCQRDLFVFLFSSGEKLSEFRERRQVGEAGCIEYDSARKQLLVASKPGLLICRKTQDYLLNFSHQRHVALSHEITTICISETSQTIFLGTSSGVILFGKYPLETTEEPAEQGLVLRGKLSSVKIHCQPLSDLKLTHNCRFLFAGIRGDGLSILRLRRIGGSLKGYSPCDLSNYNFIETSSSPYLEQLQQRLKNLLEKRKAIFNQLEEFKKEWESKRQAETKGLAVTNKYRELASVNTALNEINRRKVELSSLQEELASLQARAESTLAEEEKNHYTELLALYDQNDHLSLRFKEIEGKCDLEWSQVQTQISANLAEIHNELEAKFIVFEENYRMMRANLLASRRKVQLDEEEERAVREEQVQSSKQQLFTEENLLYARSNQLKGEITRSRKELERFSNRKDFLENKKRFFEEQMKYGSQERSELADVREELQQELAELESVTHKKERRLRKYFLENQMLIKYQLIHDNLARQSGRETEVLEQQHASLRSKIGSLQREISAVSEQRQLHCKDLEVSKRELTRTKLEIQTIRQKREFLQMQVRQIESRIALTNSGRPAEESRNQEFVAIYKEYFEKRGLQSIVSSGETQSQELLNCEKKKSDQGVKAILVDHKQYLTENMKLFQKYNSKVIEEISLTYLKHQTSNYDLISECNLRKQQINRKKRVLHELVDSLRNTTAKAANLSQPHIQAAVSPPAHVGSELPFTLYEQEKAELRKDKSQSVLWKMKKSTYQVRKMLEVQQLKGRVEAQRRIQTAKLKKAQESSYEQANRNHGLLKPQTAGGRRGSAGRMFSRNKSESKPTTCTSHRRSKYSHFA